MKILGREIKAAIFDLDGTLIDSSHAWKDVDIEFFHSRGLEIPKNYQEEIGTIGLKQAAILTKEKYGIKEEVDEIIAEWLALIKKKYVESIPLKPHAKEILEYLKNNNILLALATANDKALYLPCLKRLGIYQYFDIVEDVNKVGEGKGSVKLYHHISARLNVEPSETIIFEDILLALKTAFENNYLTIAVKDYESLKEKEEKEKYSHLYINDFKELIR